MFRAVHRFHICPKSCGVRSVNLWKQKTVQILEADNCPYIIFIPNPKELTAQVWLDDFLISTHKDTYLAKRKIAELMQKD